MAFANWIRIEKVTPRGHAEIGGRRIYILPTRYGLIYATLLFLMLLGAVNYGNNPGHLLTFLLAALGSNAIYMTWRNLRGLQLNCQGAAPIFAGQRATFVVRLMPGALDRPAIQLMFEGNPPVLLDLIAESDQQKTLMVDALPRGQHNPGRLVISTQYPLGLFRAWCYVECEKPILVYPAPVGHWRPPGAVGEAGESGEAGDGNEDFAGLRHYHDGDQPSRIDWKSYARDRGLNTRLFSGQRDAPLWINWDDVPASDTEHRLSQLSQAVVDAEAAGRSFGLCTPTETLPPGAGAVHRHRCLRHLALFGTADA